MRMAYADESGTDDNPGCYGIGVLSFPESRRSAFDTLFADLRRTHKLNSEQKWELIKTGHARMNFLLDATLGMINIQQNDIIKIFSIAAVVFLPPTLVASIYGMNFDVMPELKWAIGYPFAIFLMVLSAVLPYLYFKHKGWL